MTSRFQLLVYISLLVYFTFSSDDDSFNQWTHGKYIIRCTTGATEGESLNSKKTIKFFENDEVNIVDVKVIRDEDRIRGKLDSGEWISLEIISTKQTWVKKEESKKKRKRELHNERMNGETIKEKNKAHYEKNKEKIKERVKAYQKKHADKIKEYQHQYRETHADKLKECSRKSYEKNADYRKAYSKVYHEGHAEKLKEQKKEYQETHAHKIKETKKQYREKNADKFKQWQKQYRDKKKKE